jgi:hypothetical protein
MKKIITIVLAVAVMLSAAGCYSAVPAEKPIPVKTPQMTVIYGGGKRITAGMYTNEWNYMNNGQWNGYVADGIDPAEDEDMVTLKVTQKDVEIYGTTAILYFEYAPEKINDNEVYCSYITVDIRKGINTYYAEWDAPDKVKGEAYYAFNFSIQQ